MPKEKRQHTPTPVYTTFPTQADHVNPKTGKVEPDIESIAAVREWGEQSKL